MLGALHEEASAGGDRADDDPAAEERLVAVVVLPSPVDHAHRLGTGWEGEQDRVARLLLLWSDQAG